MPSGSGTTDLEQDDGLRFHLHRGACREEAGSRDKQARHHNADLGGVAEDVFAHRKARFLRLLFRRAARTLFARQREAALLQVVPEVVVDLDEVAGGVVDEAPSLTFPRLRNMLVEGVEGVELLKGVGDSSR